MMRGIARSVRLVKRATVPAACFGTGYVCCFAQGREESAAQIIVSGITASWTGLMRGVRQLARLAPDVDGVLREKIAAVEATELRLLRETSASFVEKGLDSRLLRYVILRQLCLCAQEDISGSAVRGLANGASGMPDSGLAELAAFIDVSAAELAGATSAEHLAAGIAGESGELLRPLASALHAIVEHGGSSWHKELDCLGVLHVARAAAIASSWLAVSQRSASLQSLPTTAVPALSAEDETEVVCDLTAVWQALSQPGAHAFIKSVPSARRSPEAAELHADLEKRFAALQAVPQPPPASASRPAKDFVPQKMRGSMMAVMRGFDKFLVSPPATAAVAHPATATQTVAASSGFRRKLGRLLECAAWGVLMGGAIVAISADGVGIFRFHVVPEQWRAPLQAIIQQRAVRVEELLAKYDPPENSPPADLDTVGSWEAQPAYIQPNFHGGRE